MSAYKDKKTGKWYCFFYYRDWLGDNKGKTKRGFETKRDALEWERNFKQTQQRDLDMAFESFVDLYYEDLTPRIRENTLRTKKYIIDLKLMPYFAKKRMNDIKSSDIRKWQNEMMEKGYSDTYLRTVNNQLTAIFNFATKYFDLKSNPCTKAGKMGKNYAEEKTFWTKDEFTQFIDAVMDKHRSYIGFNVLFWTGLRIGELLALEVGDIDFEAKTLTVSKSYQRLDKRDVITPPKTKKSNRTISIPDFLLADLKDYIASIYKPQSDDRLFPCTKHFFENEMKRGTQISGVKKIVLHSLRHSHCALLFEMGIPPLEVAERLGHDRVETTLQVYAHIYPNKQQHISEKLDQLFGGEY